MGSRLYVGNLSFNSDTESVRQAFSEIGEVTDVHIVMDRETGRSRGFAFVSLDAVYGQPAARPPFNVVAVLTTATPWGPLMSLDGVHPSAAGNALIATAAAQALNQTYNLGIDLTQP